MSRQSVEVNSQETWAQTLITIHAMPKDSSTIREIKDTARISANISESIDISKQDFIYELPLYRKDVIDVLELEQEPTRDAQNQTFLQGVSAVTIPIEYKDEAAQTIFMSSPCPLVQYEKITASISRPMPVMKYDRSNQTTISIAPTTLQHEGIESLSKITYYRDRQNTKKYEKSLQSLIDERTIVREVLNFVISRVFWMSVSQAETAKFVETSNCQVQTIIRYDSNTDKVLLDNETQTKLTCEPRHSNSKLLAEYEETKNFARCCLQECFVKGIEPRIIIDDLLDEIIVKGAERIKFPNKDRVIQTLASCRFYEDTDENVLRKLKISVVVDPLEGPIVILPLINDLLRLICNEVSRDARRIVKNILYSSIQRAALIGFKFAEKQSRPKSIEQLFDERRKKIMESMLEKQKATVATQTEFAGVPEIAKIKVSRETSCSACTRQSICHWCLTTREEDLPKEGLHTRDILVAYDPCYTIALTSEEENDSHLQPDLMRKMEKSITQPLISRCVTSEKTCVVSNETFNVPAWNANVKARDSFSKEPSITATMNSTSNVCPKSCCRKQSSDFGSFLNLQSITALQTLKSTFCTRDTCPTTFLATLKEYQLPSGRCRNKKRMTCTLGNCTLLKLDQYRNQSMNINGQPCIRPRVDKFRTVFTPSSSESPSRSTNSSIQSSKNQII